MGRIRIAAAVGACLTLAACGAPPPRYSTALSAQGNFAVLTDGKTGDTWILKADPAGTLSWIPVTRETAPAAKK